METTLPRVVGPATYDILLREQNNLQFVVLAAFVMPICIFYIQRARKQDLSNWTHLVSVRVAASIFTIFFGEFLARFWAYILLRTARVYGQEAALALEAHFPFSLVGGVFIFAGGLWLIRTLTPYRAKIGSKELVLGNWPWLIAAGTTAIAMLANIYA